ncbi:hypothetical protein TVAG_372420, partial [Trichomonas vaginalis G3]
MHHVAPHDNFTIIKNENEVIQKCMDQIDNDQSFWVADFNRVRHCLALWEENLNRVHIHYAM